MAPGAGRGAGQHPQHVSAAVINATREVKVPGWRELEREAPRQ